MKTTDYKSIANKLKFEGRAYINGKYVDAIDGEKFENINPATGDVLCSVAKCNHKDVDLAVKSARKSFESGVWSKVSPEFILCSTFRYLGSKFLKMLVKVFSK